MDIDPAYGTRVTPHQLCTLCRALVTTYSQDCFWDAEAYKENGNRYLRIDTQMVGAQAEPRAHHDSLAVLHKSAVQGCHLCAIYFGNKLWYPDDKIDSQMQLYVRAWGRSKWGCRPLVVEMYEMYPSRETGTRDVTSVEMHRHSHPGKCPVEIEMPTQDSLEARYKWCSTTDCDEGYEMISAWLQQCVDHHEPCRRRLDDVQPNRLLDLNYSLDSEDIRLVSTDDIGKQHYAALSYGWGECTSVMLKKDNFNEFRSYIKLRSLPRTIQEAVKVCRRLSVRYLWIDALCIFQENDDDFAREISQMGSIYAGSLIVVAAADSTENESGCFRERSPLQREACVVSSDEELIFFSRALAPRHKHPETLQFSKLSERAWVYQERMMSPRTLHFIRNEIIWECRERTFCYNCADKASSPSADLKYDVKKAFLGLHYDWPQSVQSAIFRLIWSTIVRKYCDTILSNMDDRLSALAGIAQLAHYKLQYQASYGLWLENILDELLWCVLIYKKPTGRNAEVLDLIPSWSWASNQCKVWYQNPSQPYLDVVQEVLHSARITKLPPVTPFGQISTLFKSCWQPIPIHIRGRLRSCQNVPTRGVKEWNLVLTTQLRRKETVDYVDIAWEIYDKGGYNDSKTYEAWCEMEIKRLGMSTNLFFKPDGELRRKRNLFCLLLKRVFGREQDPGLPYRSFPYTCASVTDFGIVLESVDLTKNLFRRVGYFHECVKEYSLRYTSHPHHPEPESKSPESAMVPKRVTEGRDTEIDEPQNKNFVLDDLKQLGFVREGEILREVYPLRIFSKN